MKLLLDANISWRLTSKLELYCDKCLHVDSIGYIIPAKDIDIWNFALNNNFIIVTNDNDFLNLAEIKGFPPKVIVLRTGNQSNNFIYNLLIKHISNIRDLFQSDDYGLIEIF